MILMKLFLFTRRLQIRDDVFTGATLADANLTNSQCKSLECEPQQCKPFQR
jgi:hypothetical protein